MSQRVWRCGQLLMPYVLGACYAVFTAARHAAIDPTRHTASAALFCQADMPERGYQVALELHLMQMAFTIPCHCIGTLNMQGVVPNPSQAHRQAQACHGQRGCIAEAGCMCLREEGLWLIMVIG